MTTVVQFSTSLRRGGSEGQAAQLARLLDERSDYRVVLACFDGDGVLRGALGEHPPEILEYPLTSLRDRNAARQLRRLVADLRRRDVQILHAHSVYSNIFGLTAARLAGVPVRIGSRRDVGGVTTEGKRRVERATFRFAQRVVTNAHAVARDLASEGVPREKIVTIHNAVDPDFVTPTRSRDEALALFGLPDGRRYVVLVANLWHDVKDHPMLLRAAARVRASSPDVGFVVAGRGSLTEPMHELARTLAVDDVVFFVGYCTAIGDLLALADVCVLTSRAEGLSNSVLEYMAAGRPVVATDVGGIGEAVVEGETGYLVPAGDDDALAERIAALLADPETAQRFGENGRERARRHFSCAQLVDRTTRLYGTMLSETRG